MGIDITVVIPTILRPELMRALESVRRQDYRGRVEVLVVADVDHQRADDSDIAMSSNERMIITGGGLRGGGARNQGVAQAAGEWIAFLDDDDEWTERHLSALMARVGEAGWNGFSDAIVLASRAKQVLGTTGAESTSTVPAQGITAGEKVEDYLFRGRRPSLDRPSIFAPTLLVSAQLAGSIPWNTSLKRHQDWDWLIRLQRSGALIEHLPDATCIVRVGSPGSISAMSDWTASLAWVKQVGADWKKQTVADFVAGQCLRYALTARSGRGAFQCLKVIVRTRRIPSLGPLLLGLAGIAGRPALERRMFRMSGGSQDASFND